MKMTSQQANKLLIRMNTQLTMLIDKEERDRTFIAAIEEDVESVRPVYNVVTSNCAIMKIADHIAAVKHAINVFNASTPVNSGTSTMTLDRVLVLLPIISARVAALTEMVNTSPKSRVKESYRSSPHIDYKYANYDIDDANTLLKQNVDLLQSLQMKLDRINSTVAGVEIPDDIATQY